MKHVSNEPVQSCGVAYDGTRELESFTLRQDRDSMVSDSSTEKHTISRSRLIR